MKSYDEFVGFERGWDRLLKDIFSLPISVGWSDLEKDMFLKRDGSSKYFGTQDSSLIKLNKAVCSSAFPPSNMYIDPETKQLIITTALAGVPKENIYVELENDMIKLKVSSNKEHESKIYAQKGLKTVENKEISWKFNPQYHDSENIDIEYTDGLLTIIVNPVESCKPKKRALFGVKQEKDSDEERRKNEEFNTQGPCRCDEKDITECDHPTDEVDQ